MKIRIKDYEIRPYDSRQYVLVKHGEVKAKGALVDASNGQPLPKKHKEDKIGYFPELFPACLRMMEHLMRDGNCGYTVDLGDIMYCIEEAKEKILEAIENASKTTTA